MEQLTYLSVFWVLLPSSFMLATLFGPAVAGGGVITLPVFPLGLTSELADPLPSLEELATALVPAEELADPLPSLEELADPLPSLEELEILYRR